MFHKFLAILFAPFLIVSACAASKTPFNSIQRITQVGNDHYCTTWATKVHGLIRWVTASHCIARIHDEDDSPTQEVNEDVKYVIGGKPANLIRINDSVDLALFSGDAAADGLMIALGEAQVGEKVKEYSFFVDTGFYSEGVASFPDKHGWRVFNLTAGSGSSGGPVMSEDNFVVGVMQFVLCAQPRGSACAALGGAGVGQIKAFLDQE